MKKLIIVFALMLVASFGFSQTYKSVFFVANSATAFGRAIPEGTVVIDYAGHAAYITTAYSAASATLATASVVAMVPSSLITDSIFADYIESDTLSSLYADIDTLFSDSIVGVYIYGDTVVGPVGYFTTIYNTDLVTNNVYADSISAPKIVTDTLEAGFIDLGYKSYVALLNQSDTLAPTATVLQNNTGVSFSFTYEDVGYYNMIASDSIFDVQKTYIVLGDRKGYGASFIEGYVDSPTVISIETYNTSGSPINYNLRYTTLEIRVYE